MSDMSFEQSLYQTLKNLPQKYCVTELSIIKKKPFNIVSRSLLNLVRKGMVQRQKFSNRVTGNVTWHYWVGRGRP